MDRRELLKRAAALCAVGLLTAPSASLAASQEDRIIATVHPELRLIARQILKYTGAGSQLSNTTLAQRRQGSAGFSAKPTSDVRFERQTIAGARGQIDVAICIVNAGAEGTRPAILHTHGLGELSRHGTGRAARARLSGSGPRGSGSARSICSTTRTSITRSDSTPPGCRPN